MCIRDRYSTRCFMIGDVLYGSAENVEVKLLDFMTEIKASEFYKAIEEEESRDCLLYTSEKSQAACMLPHTVSAAQP